jgi:hypothetical protein
VLVDGAPLSVIMTDEPSVVGAAADAKSFLGVRDNGGTGDLVDLSIVDVRPTARSYLYVTYMMEMLPFVHRCGFSEIQSEPLRSSCRS